MVLDTEYTRIMNANLTNVSSAIDFNLTNILAIYANRCKADPRDKVHCDVFKTTPIPMETDTILAVILGTTSLLFNVMSILAILFTKTKHKTNLRFMASLACSDILIGVSVVLHLLHHVINSTYKLGYGPQSDRLRSRCMYLIIKALNSTGLITCLFSLIGMAVDHYIAILYPFHHKKKLNEFKTNTLIICFWILGVGIGFSDFYAKITDIPRIIKEHHVNYCEAVFLTQYNEEFCVFVLAFLAAVILLFIYVKIYKQVKYLQKHEAELFLHSYIRRDSKTHKIFFIHSKKALVTTLLIIGTFLIFWLPLCLFEIVLLIIAGVSPQTIIPVVGTLYKVNRYLYNVTLLNSIADPIIYAVRMKDIREGYQTMWYTITCSKNSIVEMSRRKSDTQIEVPAKNIDKERDACLNS